MTLPTLTVAISTLSDRLHGITTDMLHPTDGVTYQIFVQDAKGPIQLSGVSERTDISVTPLNSHGVTHSRNAAIDAATTDILLFADDDLILMPQTYASLRGLFLNMTDLDFACGQLQNMAHKPFKSYPKHMTPATPLNTAKVGTPELAIRVNSIRYARVRFDINFGAGSQLWLGDEYIFLCDALRLGLCGHHVDLVLAMHGSDSSGHQNTASSFIVREKVFRRALGPLSWPFRIAFAVKNQKRFPDWKSFWQFMKP
jgi:glycosyltransferase involved in cell wall biosynthesis